MAGGGGGGEDGDYGFQIAPMVDVVFVLMLFFMACAGQQIVEKELGINLPSGASAPGAPRTPIIVEISADGQVRVQGQTMDTPVDKQLPALRAWLKDKIERFGPEDPVILRPANETKHERLMDVLNAAAAAGVKNLTFS